MNTFDGFPLCDVREVIANRRRFFRHEIDALRLANSFYCQSGYQPSKGYVVLPRSELDQIDKHSTTLQLDMGGLIIKNLCIVKAQCITRGLASDENALYLIEITDRRGLLYNQWFQFSIRSMYNVRSPAYPQEFYSETLNGVLPWTWEEMLQDIWNKMQNVVGYWNGIPTVPVGTPEGFIFDEDSAWKVLFKILDHLGMTIACDLTKDIQFNVQSFGQEDPEFDVLTNNYEEFLKEDYEWIGSTSGSVPKTVQVIFRRRNSILGTEETVAQSNNQWATKSTYTISVEAPAKFVNAVGVHNIWSDFTIRYDDSNNPLDADVTQAQLIAQERVSQYYKKIDPSGYIYRNYAKTLPFYTGSKIDAVYWYFNPKYQGWNTLIMSGCNPSRIEDIII